jgi:hypothetical protein
VGLFTGWAQKIKPLPGDLRSQLLAENVLVMDDAALATVTYRHYRAPGRRYGYRKLRMRVALVLTEHRLLVRGRGGPVVSVGWNEARAGGLTCSLDGDSLVVAFDAAALSADRSGQVEARIETSQAASAAAAAQAQLA